MRGTGSSEYAAPASVAEYIAPGSRRQHLWSSTSRERLDQSASTNRARIPSADGTVHRLHFWQ